MFPPSTNILVVDDMKGIRVWLLKTLQSMGYTNISEASDGEEALQILKNKKFDLVFTDIVMPKKNGLELIRDVRKDPQLSELAIIVLSAETDREMIVSAVDLGVATYVIKPATVPVLQKKMEEAYNRKLS